MRWPKTVPARDAAAWLNLTVAEFRALRIPPTRGKGPAARWSAELLIALHNGAVDTTGWSELMEREFRRVEERAKRRRPEWRGALRAALRSMRAEVAR